MINHSEYKQNQSGMNDENNTANLTAGLYIIATPIGNLDELSPRALSILSQVDLILCEDTRHTSKLLAYCNLAKPTQAYHKFNERQQLARAIAQLQKGKALALLSDAGAPGISDPGTRLINSCHENHVKVFPISGPSAVINSAMASGLVEDGFIFCGFPPHQVKAKEKWFKEFLHKNMPLIVFESPHRILSTLELLASLVGKKHTLLYTRELTKKFETIERGSVEDILVMLKDPNQLRGEITLVIAPVLQLEDKKTEKLHFYSKHFIDQNISTHSASNLLSQLTGLPKRTCYNHYLSLHKIHANE